MSPMSPRDHNPGAVDGASLGFPKLAFACPMLWAELRGDERARFCEVCGLHVRNLSALSADERAALLRHTAGRVCVTYQRRLNGEFVTPEKPLAGRERRNLRQAGAVALSAAALALAAGCVTKPEAIAPLSPPPPAATASVPAPEAPAANDDDEVIILSGFIIEADEDVSAHAQSVLAGDRRKDR